MKHINSLLCSTFQGFSKHKEDKELTSILEDIQNGRYSNSVRKIRINLQAGMEKEAGNIKKQLQAATLSALYKNRRLPENVWRYNDVIILDFDKLAEDELVRCRKIIEADGQTLFCFLSPSGNGLKVGVYLQTPKAVRLRKRYLKAKSIGFEKLETYHKEMFELCKSYYEACCNVGIDASGSDIGRLFFLSDDPFVYINREAIDAVVVPDIKIIPPAPPVKKETVKDLIRRDMPGNPEIACDHITPDIQMEFMKCITAVDKSIIYQPGQRDIYLYTLGNKCYSRKLPLVAVETLTEKFFHTPDMDVKVPVRNAYKYTSKTDSHQAGRKKPVAAQIMEFADEHYLIRRNTIMKRLEFSYKQDKPEFVPLKAMHYNTIYTDLNLAGVNCGPTTVKSVINSSYAKEFHPFEDYFYNLRPWDGETDYILELADTIQATNQVFWRDCLRRWLTGMVACALDDMVVNQLALVIKGEQGKGKSTWIRHLLPPELKLHYRNGMLKPDNKDHALALTTCLIINLEEFEGMRYKDIGELKRMITQESVMERKVFETDPDLYIRCASFIASTNEPRFLQDTTGSRRFPTITATEIDYRKPVNHTGIFSQALYLWKNGFHYWYEQEEIDILNEQNMEYTLSIPEEELFYVHFRSPLPTDYIGVKWMPAAEILSYLSIYGRVQMNMAGVQVLTRILERDKFTKRKNEHNIYEYHVKLKAEN